MKKIKAWAVLTPSGNVFCNHLQGPYLIYQTKLTAINDSCEDETVVPCTITLDTKKKARKK